MGNNGLPNTSAILAKVIVASLSLTGFWAPFAPLIEWLISKALDKGSKKLLMVADETHVALIVNQEGKDMDAEFDKAYAIVGQGNNLTQEQKDAIDKPVMDAFVKLASFRVRKPGNT